MLEHDLLEPRGGADAWALVLHGLGDNRHGWRPLAGELNRPRLGWIFVEAPEPYDEGWSWFPIPGMTSRDHGPEDMAAGIARSRNLLEEFIAALVERSGMNPERLLLLGFSQGCCMVLDHVLRSARAYAGTVAISGFVHAPEEYPLAFGPAVPRQRILWTHGTEDTVVPIAWAESALTRLRGLGLAPDWRVYPKEHTVAQDELDDIRDFMDRCLQGVPA